MVSHWYFNLHFFGAYSGVIFPCLLLLGYLLNNVLISVSNFPERLYFFFFTNLLEPLCVNVFIHMSVNILQLYALFCYFPIILLYCLCNTLAPGYQGEVISQGHCELAPLAWNLASHGGDRHSYYIFWPA